VGLFGRLCIIPIIYPTGWDRNGNRDTVGAEVDWQLPLWVHGRLGPELHVLLYKEISLLPTSIPSVRCRPSYSKYNPTDKSNGVSNSGPVSNSGI